MIFIKKFNLNSRKLTVKFNIHPLKNSVFDSMVYKQKP